MTVEQRKILLAEKPEKSLTGFGAEWILGALHALPYSKFFPGGPVFGEKTIRKGD
jgi:hypothetical protein